MYFMAEVGINGIDARLEEINVRCTQTTSFPGLPDGIFSNQKTRLG
jgi:hypothetical protein